MGKSPSSINMASTATLSTSSAQLLEEFLNDSNTIHLKSFDKPPQVINMAIIAKRGKILATATSPNDSRSSASSSSDKIIYVEKSVVRQLGDIRNLRGCDLYIMNISKDNKKDETKFMNSKPCEECQVFLDRCIREYGLNKVYFTS
jgi:hypothetical protein